MYAHRRIRPAKLSIRDGESIDVLVALTKEFNTLDGRSHIIGSLQARTWIAAPEGIEVSIFLWRTGPSDRYYTGPAKNIVYWKARR